MLPMMMHHHGQQDVASCYPRQNTGAFLASSAIRFTKTKVSLRVFTQRFVVGPVEEAALADDDQ